MPVEMFLTVTPKGFAPVTGHDHDQHRTFAVGSRVRATITRSKSKDMNAFYWALVSHVAKGIGYQKEPLSQELLIRTGHIDALLFKDGSTHAVPKSIAKMDHSIFSDYVDAAIELICREYVSGVRKSELLAEIERMVGISYSDLTKEKRNGPSRAGNPLR